MTACDCGSWDGSHEGDCSTFPVAPESQPLTEEERRAPVNGSPYGTVSWAEHVA